MFLLAEIVWPVALYIIIAILRKRFPPIDFPDCEPLSLLVHISHSFVDVIHEMISVVLPPECMHYIITSIDLIRLLVLHHHLHRLNLDN